MRRWFTVGPTSTLGQRLMFAVEERGTLVLPIW